MVGDGGERVNEHHQCGHSLYVNGFYTCIMLSYSCLISHANDRIHVIQISSGKFLKGAIGIWGRRVLYCAGLIVHILLVGKQIHW